MVDAGRMVLSLFDRYMALLPIVPFEPRRDNVDREFKRSIKMPNAVTLIPAASPEAALNHFESQFAYETDCWDTHEALREERPGFVLLDVRSPDLFAKGHVRGATCLPHRKIIASRMREYAPDTLFVTYCAGPHCNGAARAAANIARLGFRVKIMAGGMAGWIDEGFPLVSSN